MRQKRIAYEVSVSKLEDGVNQPKWRKYAPWSASYFMEGRNQPDFSPSFFCLHFCCWFCGNISILKNVYVCGSYLQSTYLEYNERIICGDYGIARNVIVLWQYLQTLYFNNKRNQVWKRNNSEVYCGNGRKQTTLQLVRHCGHLLRQKCDHHSVPGKE